MRKTYKIIFLGDTSVGKTSLISQYMYKKLHKTKPTIGIDFLSTILEIEERTIRLQLWDTAGQERFHSIIGNYTRNTSLAIIVFSIDDKNSFQEVCKWIEGYVFEKNSRDKVKLIIVANKVDILDAEWDEKKAEQIAEKYNAVLVKTSAITEEGIKPLKDAIETTITEYLKTNDDENVSSDENIITHESHGNICCDVFNIFSG